jgi:hypothetical protein
MKLLFSVLLGSLSLIVFWLALKKSQKDQFLSDTFPLIWMGIFVWGDALVLAPFWFLSSIAFIWLPWISILRWWLVFGIVREVFEVVYWLNHQASKSTYRPPLVRNFKWLSAEQGAILFQLFAMCQVVVYLLALLASFRLL